MRVSRPAYLPGRWTRSLPALAALNPSYSSATAVLTPLLHPSYLPPNAILQVLVPLIIRTTSRCNTSIPQFNHLRNTIFIGAASVVPDTAVGSDDPIFQTLLLSTDVPQVHTVIRSADIQTPRFVSARRTWITVWWTHRRLGRTSAIFRLIRSHELPCFLGYRTSGAHWY